MLFSVLLFSSTALATVFVCPLPPPFSLRLPLSRSLTLPRPPPSPAASRPPSTGRTTTTFPPSPSLALPRSPSMLATRSSRFVYLFAPLIASQLFFSLPSVRPASSSSTETSMFPPLLPFPSPLMPLLAPTRTNSRSSSTSVPSPFSPRSSFIRFESLSLKDATQPQFPALAFSHRFRQVSVVSISFAPTV
jgi:hypothetical protein